MDIYDVTDDFIDSDSKAAKKNQKKSKVKFISDLDSNIDDKSQNKKNKKENPFQIFMRMSLFGKTFILAFFFLFICVILGGLFFAYADTFNHPENVNPLSQEELTSLNSLADQLYPSQRKDILRPLPYSVKAADLDVWAGSAICIDASNGCVLYEKNADEIIPPASIAKLFVMYIVFKDVAAGKVSLEDLVSPPEKSWAINMPSDASLMFLGQGHIVTLRELLKGLAVASGNDAALAVASHISGSTQAFVDRMNEECQALGLEHTHFVEPSGYDEHNLTTARELAAFCREYVTKFPQSVEEFHSAPSIRYPLEKNLPSWQKKLGNDTAIFQKNTNPLLGLMEGCDGIKTGFIYESRYNLALTAKRNGVRFISITMKGTGVGSKQGNAGRVHDGTEMMEWAFDSFADFDPSQKFPQSYPVASLAVKSKNGKYVNLIPAWTTKITVPHLYGSTVFVDVENVAARANVPKYIYGEVKAGQPYGQIQYMLGDVVLETVPLIADRNMEEASFAGKILGSLIAQKMN